MNNDIEKALTTINKEIEMTENLKSENIRHLNSTLKTCKKIIENEICLEINNQINFDFEKLLDEIKKQIEITSTLNSERMKNFSKVLILCKKIIEEQIDLKIKKELELVKG